MLQTAPYDGVQTLILALMNAGHEVHLATARGFEGERAQVIREETRTWIAAHDIPHDSLTFAQNKAALDLDYFLDDGAHNVKALRFHGCEAYLRTQPHNVASTLPRVDDLAAFVQLVLSEAALMNDVC
jgi:5'(3')-deoxyribonucleotidase